MTDCNTIWSRAVKAMKDAGATIYTKGDKGGEYGVTSTRGACRIGFACQAVHEQFPETELPLIWLGYSSGKCSLSISNYEANKADSPSRAVMEFLRHAGYKFVHHGRDDNAIILRDDQMIHHIIADLGIYPATQKYRTVRAAWKPEVKMELGSGTQAVYGYSFPHSPQLIKIGKAESDPVARILEQIGTSNSHPPTVEFILWVDNCHNVESMIHSMLKSAGRHHASPVGGTEWFTVTNREVIAIYEGFIKVQPAA